MSRSPSSRFTAHQLALIVHRYVGLVMAAFLIVAGFTGTVIAFDTEIDSLINPELFLAEPATPGQTPLDPFELRDAVQKQFPEEKLNGVSLHREPGESALFWLTDKQVFIDPYTGAVLGSRVWGDITEGLDNIVTFFYRLHFTLALDDVGYIAFGCVSLLWTIDCFVGAYLTFPRPTARGGRRTPRNWLKSWAPMWLLKTTKLFTLVFTWHRASGLWVWLMFLIFAWSGVAMNLNDAYEPVMNVVLGPEPVHQELPELTPPRENPKLSLRQALDVGRRLIASESPKRDIEARQEHYLTYEPDHGVYVFGFESSRDLSPHLANTSIVFDGDTGELLKYNVATGENRASTFRAWIIALHFGQIGALGLPYRVFVATMGLVVVLLSVTGVWIWWVKRKKRAA